MCAYINDTARSWLFTPANHSRRSAKALAGAADAVIIDLEDAVPEDDKAMARATLADELQRHSRANLYVRINALDTVHAMEDVAAIVSPGLSGVVLPKSESSRDIAILDWLLTQMERGAGLAANTFEIIPLLETAVAFERLGEICRASRRVRRLAFGAADFTADLRLHWSKDEHELRPWRAAMVLASRAAGLEPPIDTPWIRIADREGMLASAHRSRHHGFAGKMCIHPDQIELVHEAYRPTQAEIAEAQQILSAFAASGGAATSVDGRMIDGPVADAARRLLIHAGALELDPEMHKERQRL